MVWHLPKTGTFLLETWLVSFHLAWYTAANPPFQILHWKTTLPQWLPEPTSRTVLGSPEIIAGIFRASQFPDTYFGPWQLSWLQSEEPPFELQGASHAASKRMGASQDAPGSHGRARSQKLWQLLIVSFRKIQTTFFYFPELKIFPFSFEWKILKCHFLFQFSTKTYWNLCLFQHSSPS